MFCTVRSAGRRGDRCASVAVRPLSATPGPAIDPPLDGGSPGEVKPQKDKVADEERAKRGRSRARQGVAPRDDRGREKAPAGAAIAANPWVRRQVPIGRFVADSICHEARLIVEIDGGQRDASSEPEASRTSTSLRKLAHVIPTFSSCPRKRASRAQAPEAALDSRLRGSDDTRV